MSVENVSNNSNAGLYAAGAALVGGGAGAAAGWYSRPFLKDGTPTDSFVKQAKEKVLQELPENQRNFLKSLNENFTKITNAKNVEEIKTLYKENMIKMLDLVTLEDVKSGQTIGAEYIQSLGINISDVDSAIMEKIKNANSMDEVKALCSEMVDNSFSNKTLEELKTEAKEGLRVYNEFSKQTIIEGFNAYWDKSKKVFVDCSEGLGKDLKSIAHGIQGKYAAIYGGIAAAVLGLGTYLCCRGGGEKAEVEQPQTDVQA